MRWIAPLCGFLIFLADWLSKRWAQSNLPGRPLEVIEGYFRLRYVENEGIAFGLLHDLDAQWKPYLLGVAAVAALLLVLYYVRSTPKGERLLFVCFGLLLGGIVGNFYDRLAHGSVVDFLELHWRDAYYWPTFNLADASITCGVLLILLHTFFAPQGDSEEASAAKTSSAAAGRGACLLPLLLLFPHSTLNASQDAQAGELLQKVQQRYQDIRGFSADFRQVTDDRGLIQTETGVLVMEKPGKMYWEYRNPDEKYFVSDGRKSYFYDVAQRQVMISTLDLEAQDTPLLYLLGKGNLGDRFQVEWASVDKPMQEGHEVLLLRPRRPREDFEILMMEVDPGNGLIHRLAMVDPLGARTDYVLSDLKINPDVPESRFRFDIPKGVETIER